MPLFLQCSNPKWRPKTCLDPSAEQGPPKLCFSSYQICICKFSFSRIRAYNKVIFYRLKPFVSPKKNKTKNSRVFNTKKCKYPVYRCCVVAMKWIQFAIEGNNLIYLLFRYRFVLGDLGFPRATFTPRLSCVNHSSRFEWLFVLFSKPIEMYLQIKRSYLTRRLVTRCSIRANILKYMLKERLTKKCHINPNSYVSPTSDIGR